MSLERQVFPSDQPNEIVAVLRIERTEVGDRDPSNEAPRPPLGPRAEQ